MRIFSIIRSFIFGPFLLLGFLAGLFVVWRKGREEYYDVEQLFDTILGAVFWGTISARFGFILVHFKEFGFDVLRWFSLFQSPGYIGIIGMVIGYVYLFSSAKRKKWDVFEIADFVSLGLSLALVFLYAGMFFNGSGFGNPTKLPIGVTFPGVFDKRHPTQLYFSLFFTGLFILLWRLESIYRTFLWYRSNKRTAQSGFVFSVFCIGYGIIGMFISFVQPQFYAVFAVSLEALLRLVILLYGVLLLYRRSGRSFALFSRR